MLGANGYIHGFTMASAEDSFTVSAHVPVEGAKSIGAAVGAEVISGGAELTIGAGSSLSIEKSLSVEAGSALVLGAGTELRFNWISDTNAYSQLSVLDGGSLDFSSDTKIIIGGAGADARLGSFTLIEWADGSTMPDWSSLTKGGGIALIMMTARVVTKTICGIFPRRDILFPSRFIRCPTRKFPSARQTAP